MDASKETRPYPAPEPVTAALLFSRDICIAPVAPPSCCPKSSATAPVMFRISSRPQLPASRSAPSTQFRKGARLFENFIGLKGFSPSPRPFRAWALGADREAGSWQKDELRSHSHKIMSYNQLVAGNHPHYAGGAAAYLIESEATGGAETRPVNIAQPVITYLGRPK